MIHEFEYLKRLRLAIHMPDLGRLKSKKLAWKLNYDDACQAFLEYPETYIATSMFIPTEIVASFDYPFIPYEPLAVSIGMMNYNKGLLERVERRFEGMQICSPIEIMLGMLEEEMIPPPGAIILSSFMCDDAQNMYELIAKKYNCKTYFIDVPFNREQASVEYIKTQLIGLKLFLEKYLGREMNETKFSQSIEYSNNANSLRKEILDLRSRHHLTDLSDVFPLYPLFTKFGRKEPVSVLEAVYNEMLAHIKNTEFSNQKFRVLWLGMIPLLRNNIIRALESDYGISVALEENSVFSLWENIDPANPLDGLAMKTLSYHAQGSITRRIAAIEKFIDLFAIDGIIHFSHQGCRAYNGGAVFISAVLRMRNLPYIELNGDIIDDRNFPEESIRLRLEAFSEQLRQAKVGE